MKISSGTGKEITLDSFFGLMKRYYIEDEVDIEMRQTYMQYPSWDSRSDFYLFDPQRHAFNYNDGGDNVIVYKYSGPLFTCIHSFFT
jgi:hypothetical protein